MELEDRPPTLRDDVTALELRIRSSRYEALALVTRARAATMPEPIIAAANQIATQLFILNRQLDDLGEIIADEDAKRFVAALPEHAKTGGAE